MEVDHEEADAPLSADFADILPLVPDSDSDSNAPDTIPGTQFAATQDIQSDERRKLPTPREKACQQCIKRPK